MPGATIRESRGPRELAVEHRAALGFLISGTARGMRGSRPARGSASFQDRTLVLLEAGAFYVPSAGGSARVRCRRLPGRAEPRNARQLAGSLPPALELGSGGEGYARLAQLPERVQLRSLREGRRRRSRGADGQLRGVRAGRARLQSARLSDGRLLHGGDVRPEPAPGAAQAGRRARRRAVAADFVGPGARGNRREAGGRRREGRDRQHHPRPRAALRSRPHDRR